MSREFVTIATFDESVDAHVARSQLERKGIPAVVVDELVSSWHAGGTAVEAQLQVEKSNVALAREYLLAQVATEEDLTGFWRCVECQVVVDPGFDVCWSCLRHHAEVRDASFRPTRALVNESDDSEPSSSAPLVLRRRADPSDDSHESRTVDETPSVHPSTLRLVAQPELDDRIVRAWRASVLGLIVFPPLLNVYSMYLLLRIGFAFPALSRRSNLRFYAALIINMLSGLAIGVYQWLGLFG